VYAAAGLQNIRSLLSKQELARWEDLELKQSLQRMPDVVFCPRCSAPCLEDSDNCAQCSKCFFTFCSLCDESWHPGFEVEHYHRYMLPLRQPALSVGL
jgi:E3 ubiquitin-protein ligase RNF14